MREPIPWAHESCAENKLSHSYLFSPSASVRTHHSNLTVLPTLLFLWQSVPEGWWGQWMSIGRELGTTQERNVFPSHFHTPKTLFLEFPHHTHFPPPICWYRFFDCRYHDESFKQQRRIERQSAKVLSAASDCVPLPMAVPRKGASSPSASLAPSKREMEATLQRDSHACA
jgi:hypothetical protein